ncbi:hypothetical protein [Kordia zhangzhouensis]|uniref:hypothetical protein n=1 Tax=Kordia zhangzhouensis TaxID=1620405 RepID=UPI000A4A6DE8|nr:hypothetical protein [Kordia zhangzhouensis]
MKLSIKQFVSFAVCMLIAGVAFSQSARSAVQASMFHNDLTLQAQMQKNFKSILEANINGTPYYDDSFNSAKIMPIDKVYMIRYNAALDDMEVIQSTDTLIMNKNNRSYVIKQNKGNITYKILEYDESDGDRLGYYVQLTDDSKITLYRKDRKKFVEEKKASYNGNLGGVSAKFKSERSEFFIEIDGSGSAILVPRRKKDVIKLFPGKEKEVEKFIKEKKIKTTKEEDLIKLINYINTL